MSRLKLLPFRDLRKVALAAGFLEVRQEGSHHVFQNSEGFTIVIPDHGSKEIVRPLLRKLVRDMGLTLEQYERLTREV